MSVAAVIELSQELHRLAVAGVGLAKGDHRVVALLPALERSGEKVPVFARIAARTRVLLAASKATAADDFLQLNTLVGAVLKAQGKAGIEGDLVPLPSATTSARQIPARFLNEVRSDRYAVDSDFLHDAIGRGWFGDVRLARFALEALDDGNAELANLAATTLLPPYGKGIVPLLVGSLELSSRRPAARVIETVRRADAESGAALARQILDPRAERVFELVTDGVTISDEAVVAALGCLGDDAADRGVLLDHLDARRKACRVAALSRLLALGDADAEARAVAMLGGSAAKSREAVEAIPALSGPATSEPVVARAHELAKALDAAKPATADANDAVRVLALLVRSASAPERFEAMLSLFERFETIRDKASDRHESTTGTLIDRLFEGCPAARRKALVQRAMPFAPGVVTLAAIRRFGPVEALSLLEQTKKRDFVHGLVGVFPSDFGERSYRERDLPPPAEWSPEWLALGLRHRLTDLVDYLWSLDPRMVTEHVLARKVKHGELAIVALVADPGCAGALRPVLDERGEDRVRFDSLCEAIVDGDRARALELVQAIPRHFGRERLATLHARLADHFPEASA